MPGIGVGIGIPFRKHEDESSYWTTQPEFTLELETTAANQSVTLPLLQNFGGGANYSYNFTVTWGDAASGTVTSYNDADATHVFVTPGRYIIKISGTCESFYINEAIVAGTGDTELLWTRVCGWGTVGIKKLCFKDCLNLRDIPPDLLGGLALLTDMDYTFFIPHAGTTDVQGIREIPAGLLTYCTLITSYHYTFHGIYITEIPEHLFDNSTLVDDFQTCFESCKYLVTIPAELFRYNVDVTNFKWVFSDCWALVTIPSGLFDYNVSNLSFEGAFRVNKSLTTVPTDLFRYCTAVTTFEACFNGCEDLQTIPTDLFRYNTAVTTFKNTFSNAALTSIPADLFRYNTLVTTFESVFNGCDFATIPTDTFRYNTVVVSFQSAFSNSLITAIPATLFTYTVLVEDFKWTFYNCNALTAIPATLFDTTTAVTTFEECFRTCDVLAGAAPQLWVTYAGATGTDCFKDSADLTNYNYIPEAWGGLGYTAIVKNGGFDADSDWSKLLGTSIGDGIATVAALGGLDGGSAAWSLNQTPNEQIEDEDVVDVSFRARITSGSGKFQFSIGYEVYFNQTITGTMTEYSFQVTRDVVVANYKICFGGETSGDIFELDDVLIERVV